MDDGTFDSDHDNGRSDERLASTRYGDGAQRSLRRPEITWDSRLPSFNDASVRRSQDVADVNPSSRFSLVFDVPPVTLALVRTMKTCRSPGAV